MSAPAGWYPNPIPDAASLAKGKYRYWDGVQWMPRYADVPPREQAAKPEPALLVQTSGDLYLGGEWKEARKQASFRGWIVVIEEDGVRRLGFVCDSGVRPLQSQDGQQAIPAADILRIVKVKGAMNTIVEVNYRGQIASISSGTMFDAFCLVGPRDRINAVCAALGHPI